MANKKRPYAKPDNTITSETIIEEQEKAEEAKPVMKSSVENITEYERLKTKWRRILNNKRSENFDWTYRQMILDEFDSTNLNKPIIEKWRKISEEKKLKNFEWDAMDLMLSDFEKA